MAAQMQLRADAVSVDDAIANMRQSNKLAADIFTKNNSIAATDVTGFGLARHGQNLAMRVGVTGCAIDLASLPLLDGVTHLIEAGFRSSLHEQNQLAVTIHDHASHHKNRTAILFDPQTSGGLLAAVPEAEADTALARLHEAGINAARVGRLTDTAVGLSLSG